jgi:hypothetical protein
MSKVHIPLFEEYFINEADVNNNQALVKSLETQVETLRNNYNNSAEQFRNNKIQADQLMIVYKAYLDKDVELKMTRLKSKLDDAGQNIKQATQDAAKVENPADQPPK